MQNKITPQTVNGAKCTSFKKYHLWLTESRIVVEDSQHPDVDRFILPIPSSCALQYKPRTEIWKTVCI